MKNNSFINIKAWLGTIKPIKDFYLAHVKGYDGYVRIYPTLTCNLKCGYCSNSCHRDNGEDRSAMYEEADWQAWAKALKRLNRPIAITGGEPSLYTGMIDLLNALAPSPTDNIAGGMTVKFYTNLMWSKNFMDRWLNEMNNANVQLFVSYHSQAPIGVFMDKLSLLRERGKFMGVIHTILTKENTEAIEEAKKVFAGSGFMLMIDDDYDYKYHRSCLQKQRLKVSCEKKNILIAPNGDRYQCVSKMLRMKDPVENIFDENCAKPDPRIRSICHDYGYCANCDTVYATKIKVLR